MTNVLESIPGGNTQIAEGMVWSSKQNAMTSKAKPVPGAWMLAWNQGLGAMVWAGRVRPPF